jgi:hypothetical protein
LAHFYIFAGKNKNDPKMGLKMKRKMATVNDPIIASRLHRIYSLILEKGMLYEPWKQFTTVVLRKPGKPKYNVPKAYRPIALLNTMVKVLTAILAEQMMYYAEQHKMLPANHFGG